jgi:hypothetical protein
MWIFSFPSNIFEEAVFSPSCILGFFVKDQLALNVWVYAWVFYSDPLVYLSIFVPILKSGIVMPPAVDFLLRIALAIRGLLCFHMYFRIDFSFSVQAVIGILIGIA